MKTPISREHEAIAQDIADQAYDLGLQECTFLYASEFISGQCPLRDLAIIAARAQDLLDEAWNELDEHRASCCEDDFRDGEPTAPGCRDVEFDFNQELRDDNKEVL